jgi:hypothetical protein
VRKGGAGSGANGSEGEDRRREDHAQETAGHGTGRGETGTAKFGRLGDGEPPCVCGTAHHCHIQELDRFAIAKPTEGLKSLTSGFGLIVVGGDHADGRV